MAMFNSYVSHYQRVIQAFKLEAQTLRGTGIICGDAWLIRWQWIDWIFLVGKVPVDVGWLFGKPIYGSVFHWLKCFEIQLCMSHVWFIACTLYGILRVSITALVTLVRVLPSLLVISQSHPYGPYMSISMSFRYVPNDQIFHALQPIPLPQMRHVTDTMAVPATPAPGDLLAPMETTQVNLKEAKGH